jgi:tRNA pseudouridine38-40 synthase
VAGAAEGAPVARLLIAYDGTGFRGWARQRDASIRTVQGVLEAALGRVLRGEPRLAVAGRTDAGVHARGQVASFEPGGAVDLRRLRAAVDAMVGSEVSLREASPAPAWFHARHSAAARIYTYRIDTGSVGDPFTARFVWHRHEGLSVPAMRAGARALGGEHDFASFGRSGGGPTVRRLERIAIRRLGDRVELTFRANAFLHQMVRSLVGTLVDVGAGRIAPEEIGPILAARERSRAGRLAPPHGLTLEAVIYPRAAASRGEPRSRDGRPRAGAGRRPQL